MLRKLVLQTETAGNMWFRTVHTYNKLEQYIPQVASNQKRESNTGIAYMQKWCQGQYYRSPQEKNIRTVISMPNLSCQLSSHLDCTYCHSEERWVGFANAQQSKEILRLKQTAVYMAENCSQLNVSRGGHLFSYFELIKKDELAPPSNNEVQLEKGRESESSGCRNRFQLKFLPRCRLPNSLVVR